MKTFPIWRPRGTSHLVYNNIYDSSANPTHVGEVCICDCLLFALVNLHSNNTYHVAWFTKSRPTTVMHLGILYEPILLSLNWGSIRAFSRIQSMHEFWIRGELERTKLKEPEEDTDLAHDVESSFSEVGRICGAWRWTKNVRTKDSRQVILPHFILFLMFA